MSSQRYTASELIRLLGQALVPLVVLDEDRRIVFCNDACAALLGLAAEQLIGQVCNYQTPEGPPAAESSAAALCPPPQAFAGQTATALVRIARPDGSTVCRQGYFFPLADGQDQSSEVLAILEAVDVDETKLRAPVELHEQVRRFRAALAGRYQAEGLLGTSPAIERVRRQIELAAASRAATLLVGGPGSGRQHAAKTIHYRSRASEPLVPLDCGLLEASLLRSTLRALWAKHAGEPSGATLLLLQADLAPPEIQAELVALAQQPSTVRVLATAEQPLVKLADEGHYSRELAEWLSTFTIELSPLAARMEDLPLLAQALLERVNAAGGKQVAGFAREALERLALYAWPGNLDELTSVVEQAHAAAQGAEITSRDLAREIHWSLDAATRPKREEETIVIDDFLARVELELITRALRRAGGDKSKAARLLGWTRPRLYRRLVQLGLEAPEEPSPESEP